MPDTATEPDVLLDDMADASLDLISAVNEVAAAVTTLVEQASCVAPKASAAALDALQALLAAAEPVQVLVGQLDE